MTDDEHQAFLERIDPGVVEWVEQLHAAVDALLDPIADLHQGRLNCKRGCNACCLDDLSVFAIEAAVIARHHAELLERGLPHPEGACAFLDAHGACRVYEHRPYVCRTQGLPLRWASEDETGQPVELRDVCRLNVVDDSPVERLASEECWTLGPVEQRLRTTQERVDGGTGHRVALRDLFVRIGD